MKALTIRRLRPSDAEALYRILSDRQVMRYLEPPYDRLQTEQFLREAGLAEPPIVRAGADARPQAMRRKAASAAPR